jgi:hypothetical protein
VVGAKVLVVRNESAELLGRGCLRRKAEAKKRVLFDEKRTKPEADEIPDFIGRI